MRGESGHYPTVVVGAGQAGLAVGYHLKRLGVPFVILEAGERVGESWRQRWDSLRLFTPAELNSLPGMPFPALPEHCPGKDEMADYLAAYAERFDLPVRLEVRVERLGRKGEAYELDTSAGQMTAENVVVATGSLQRSFVPAFAGELDRSICQLHSRSYRRPGQLPQGTVLVVGAGNSGAEIAMDVIVSGRRVLLSGRDPGHIPGGSWWCRATTGGAGRARLVRLTWPAVWWLLTHRLTADTRLGRKIMGLRQGRTSSPLVRLTPGALAGAGVERLPRTKGVAEGLPRLADGRVVEADAIVWATGYVPDFGWIELPIFDGDGYPRHQRGVATGEPGLHFIGLPFQHTLVSEMVAGEVFDAAHTAERVAQRCTGNEPSTRDGTLATNHGT